MATARVKPSCKRSTEKPCHLLLTDPESAWPDHICPEIARESCRRWAEERAEDLYGKRIPRAVREWIMSYPLPVGRWNLPADLPTGLAPLCTFEMAALILAPTMPFATCVAFGIIDDHPLVHVESDDVNDMMRASMQFTSSGWQSDRIGSFQKRAEKWWRGQSATGRETGPKISKAQARDAFISYREHMNRSPKQGELAAELDITPRTLRNIVGDWRTFQCDAETWAKWVAKQMSSLPSRAELARMRSVQTGK